MKYPQSDKSRLLQAGIIIILISIVFDLLYDNLIPKWQTRKDLQEIQETIIEKETKINKTFDNIEKKKLGEVYQDLGSLINVAKNDKLLYYIYDQGQLILWNSNKVLPDQKNPLEDESKLEKLPNGYYLQINRSVGNFLLVALIPIQYNYPYENDYLKNKFLLGKHHDWFSIETNPESNNSNIKEIYNKKGHAVFKVNIHTEKSTSSFLYLLYLLSAALLFIYLNKQITNLFVKGNFYKGLVIYILSILVTFLGWKVFKIPVVLFSHPIFSPAVYASSSFFASIGDLVISTFLLFWTINIFTKHLHFKLKLTITTNIALGAALIIGLIFLLSKFSDIISNLVIDSKIPLDMNDFFRFDFYSLISFFIIFLLIVTYIRLNIFLVRMIINKNMKWWHWAITFLIPAIIYLLYCTQNNEFSVLNLTFPIIIWILFVFFEQKNKITLNSILAFAMIGSAFVSNQIIKANELKERENRKHLISLIATERDAIGEDLMMDEITKIKNDNYIQNYFFNPLVSKSTILKRLKRMYFSGYFAIYEMNAETYTPNGLPFKSNDFIPIELFREVMKKGVAVDSKGEVYFRNTYDGAPVYIINLIIVKDGVETGRLIIELKQKPFLEESVYPELIIERNVKRSEAIRNYSYAIYIDDYLANQKGEYSYPVTYRLQGKTSRPYYFFSEKNYNHLVYNLNRHVSVIMSHEKNSIFSSLALFSFLFILSTLTIAISLYFSHVVSLYDKQGYQSVDFWKSLNPLNDLYFKSKIQLTILIAVFIGLILTGFFTIRFIQQSYNKNISSKLHKEIRLVTESITPLILKDSNSLDDINVQIKETSDLFRTDINIFDQYGNLVGSSQMPIYDRKIIAKMIDAEAYYNLWILEKSQLVQYEKIGGKIKFLSAYAPIRNELSEIIGFINIPFYSKEKELKAEIANLIVTIVNLYVFLFLLIILISIIIANTFSEPLELIRKHMSDIDLGKSYKKISYKSADEIGSLIREYNLMLDKVQESAEALAQSERESAWREMAKQVAHEIKNPLTPMKLNLQQLLRAWNDKTPDIDTRFRKTVEILINRIDTLSQIATEFSAFARMPKTDAKVIVIENVLREQAELYNPVERVELVLDFKTENTPVYADENQMARAFNNLLRNSIQAIPNDRKGNILISSEIIDDHILLSIKDNGTGISPEITEKIFLPNFSTKSSGMGLGLAIVAKIIRSALGKIWFETEENIGSTFFISLPVYSPEENDENS